MSNRRVRHIPPGGYSHILAFDNFNMIISYDHYDHYDQTLYLGSRVLVAKTGCYDHCYDQAMTTPKNSKKRCEFSPCGTCAPVSFM